MTTISICPGRCRPRRPRWRRPPGRGRRWSSIPARRRALRQHRTGGLFHGGWAYRRELFRHAAATRPSTTAKTRPWPGGSSTSAPRRPIPVAGLPALLRLLLERRRLAPLRHGQRGLSAARRRAGGRRLGCKSFRPAARPRPSADPSRRSSPRVLNRLHDHHSLDSRSLARRPGAGRATASTPCKRRCGDMGRRG